MSKFNLEEFKKSLEGKTQEELKKLELEIINECEAIDVEVSKTEFDMPAENYSEVAAAIRHFLNEETVQWQYTLGMVAMYDFWTEDRPNKIPYAQLDSVLRTIGNLQFKGYENWCRVIAINKYFEPLREQYVETTQRVYDAATKHQTVMEAIGLSTPIE
jgi:hypothetical protein